MNICYVIGALPSAGERFTADAADLVIAADAGWQTAEGYGLVPALAVGDFDTAPPPDHIPVIAHPVRKDDTDLLLAVRIGLKRGYRTFVLAGAAGGRPDHTFAAYQVLRFLKDHGARGYLTGEGAVVTLLSSEELTVPAEAGTTFSLFATGGDAEGVTIRGASYPLENGKLTESFPLGVSNAFTDAPLTVSIRRGNLLMMTVCSPERSFDLISAMTAGRQAILPLSGVIFDMDGTLIDSNPRWDQVGLLYLERYGFTAPEDFLYHVHTKPVPELTVYLKETFGLDITPEVLSREVISLMDDYYRTEAVAKAGALDLIRRLEEADIPYCIATAAERSHVEAGLATVGITGQRFILTCTEAGADKRSPTVFERALELLGGDRATTAVVEDSPTALATAKRAGFYTVSVYDDSFVAREEEKRRIADLAVESLEEFGAVELRKI